MIAWLLRSWQARNVRRSYGLAAVAASYNSATMPTLYFTCPKCGKIIPMTFEPMSANPAQTVMLRCRTLEHGEGCGWVGFQPVSLGRCAQ
jgi:hypothetical protein